VLLTASAVLLVADGDAYIFALNPRPPPGRRQAGL